MKKDHSYSITKYDPKKTLYNEWTNFADVGRQVDIQTYKRYENAYIQSIIVICNFLNIKSLNIKELECQEIPNAWFEKQTILVQNISLLVKEALREVLWCKLTSKDLEIHFGYDFYMYAVSNHDLSKCFDHIDGILHVVKKDSPYQ